MNRTGKIYGINGPVIYIKGQTDFKMSEMVYVGEENLVGEVISLSKDRTTIQVYEETTGLKPGETVTATGDAVSVMLGPGIIHNIFDGIQRPLEEIAKDSFLGGIRATIPQKNILIDHSFAGNFEAAYKEFKFDGGPEHE